MGLSCCLIDSAGKLALAVVAAKLAMAVWRVVFPYLVAPKLGMADKIRAHLKPGDWAVVTGATDGIGKAYARELANRGANLVLVGRNPSKLQDVKNELSQGASETQFKLLTFDFAHSTWQDYASLSDALRGLTIGALVNSVGISYTELASLGNLPSGDQLSADLLNVNSLSVTLLCRMVLEGMVERKRGAVINIASFSGCHPTPFLSVYAASKKYVGFLTECLNLEYAGTGVEIQCVYPQFVATKMSGMRPTFSCPTPESYAASALGTFGLQKSSFGCLNHAMAGEIFSLLPESLATHFIKSAMVGLMQKQERKKAKAAKAE